MPQREPQTAAGDDGLPVVTVFPASASGGGGTSPEPAGPAEQE